MTLKITVQQPLAGALQTQAEAEQVSVEEFAVRVLSDAVAQRVDGSDCWNTINQRRVELIRKSNRETLSQKEHDELQQLQTEMDQKLEQSDCQLIDQLQHMEEAVARLPDHE